MLKTVAVVGGVPDLADDSVKYSCGTWSALGVLPVGPVGHVEEDAGHVADVTAGSWAATGLGDFSAAFSSEFKLFSMTSSSTFWGVNGIIPLQYNFLPKFSFPCIAVIRV